MRPIREGVNVSIMGKQFSVYCPEHARGALFAAAEYLDHKMREIHASGKVIGLERCAIMAALNIAHELLDLRNTLGVSRDFEKRIKSLQHKLDTALQEQSELRL